MLKHRIITAAILIPIFLAILFFATPPVFCFFIALVTLGAAWEWSNLMGLKSFSHRLLYLVITLFFLFNALFIPITYILGGAFIWWLIAAVLVIRYSEQKPWWGKGLLWRGLMGLFVLIPCWASVNYIRSQSDGLYALLYLFILIWGADSAAYFAGKLWGKTKLIPAVSPGKSVQGLCGALFFTVILSVAVLWFSQTPVSTWVWGIALSVMTVLFSVLGDLFESMLKRHVNIKDSGRLLPGHGGLLDRIDSLTAAAPIFALGALLIGLYVH